jgi:hypothetical protein
LLDKYTASFAEALAVTESLPVEEERLLASYRNNYKLIGSTEELALLDVTWSHLGTNASDLLSKVQKFSDERKTEMDSADVAIEQLGKVRQPLADSLDELNKGLTAAEAAPTLDDKLTFVKNSVDSSIGMIGDVLTALGNAKKAAAGKPGLSRLQETVTRLEPLVPKIREYFGTIFKGPTRAADQQVSLVVEATRLARDILSIEVEIADLEIAYHEELKDLSEQARRVMVEERRVNFLVATIKPHANGPEKDRKVADSLKNLASQGDSQEQALQEILQNLAVYYSAQIETSRAKDMLELRQKILAYRQAKLLDVAYDRQRRTLISYGLLAAVRYAEGGWKTEDTSLLLGLIQTGLQGGLLAKL